MGQNPYPVEIAGPGGGPVKTAGDLTFTDPGNQPGGGSSAPNSWLNAFVNTGLTANDVFSWGENDHQGTDIAINGIDDTVIDILTAGTYTVVAIIDFAAAADSSTATIKFDGDIAGLGWPGGGDASSDTEALNQNQLAVRTLVMPNVVVPASTTVQLRLSDIGGTITVGASGSMAVIKVA